MRLALAGCALLLVALPLHADDRWVDSMEYGRFALRTEVELPKRLVIVNQLRELESDLGKQLDLKLPEAHGPEVQINLFRSARTYRQHLAARVPEAASRPASFVQGTDLGRVYLVSDDDINQNLLHESTHALLHVALPFVPLWLDEGLAVYFETTPTKRAYGSPHLSRVRWAMKWGWRPDLHELEERETLSDMKPADYRHAWAWTHFLLHDSDESRALLVGYLSEIQSGVPPGPLSLRIRERMPDAQQKIVKHFESWGK